MKKILLFLSVYFLCNISFSQSALVEQENLKKVGENWFSGSVITFDNRYKGTLGSPLLLKDWSKGSITLKSDTTIVDVSLRYNVLEGKIYRQTKGEKANLILNSRVKSFTLSEKNFIVINLTSTNGDALQGYAESLSTGILNLLAIPTCRIRPSDSNNAYGTGRQYDEYIHNEQLYINASGTSIALKVKASKKFFLELMQDKEAEIKKYFKYQKPYLKERTELIRLVNFYNQLIH